MRYADQFTTPGPFVLTDKGLAAANTDDTCDCDVFTVKSGIYSCLYCGTVYAVVMHRTYDPQWTANKRPYKVL